jgi:hypothetical protein
MINKINTLFFLILFFWFVSNCNAQQLQNPSFEGAIGIATLPQAWLAMGESSSPDTQPGAWSVTKEASHGNSYISMVCRGFSIIDSYQWEKCYQSLSSPLRVGETYSYSIDLSHSANFIADTIKFNKPVNLRIWGMNENKQEELLWESGVVNNLDWKTFYFDLKPSVLVEYLILEAYYIEMPKYNGNVLIDNLQYYPKGRSILDSLKKAVEEYVVVQQDFVVELDGTGKVLTINDRKVNDGSELVVKNSKLSITVWDNRLKDGDIISLFINEKNVLKEFMISKKRLTFDVELAGSEEYYLTLYAHNLGEIPPNTVALYLGDGKRKKLITLSSDLKSCGSIKIKIQEGLVEAEI